MISWDRGTRSIISDLLQYIGTKLYAVPLQNRGGVRFEVGSIANQMHVDLAFSDIVDKFNPFRNACLYVESRANDAVASRVIDVDLVQVSK